MTRRPATAARKLSWEAPLVAAGIGILAALLGWRGVDLPAQVYRVALFRQDGLTVWDSQWYGGHWTLDYSVIFPPVAGVIGVAATSVLSAAVAAWAFDRLVMDHFGPTARFGSLAFALGTVVQTAIGQLPFLMGEALALSACWAATRRRWPLAVVLAVATSLASPLAGAFLVLAIVSWLLATWPRHSFGIGLLAGAVAAPVAIISFLFPGQGAFPYPSPDFVVEAVICIALWILIPPRERVLRIAARLYMLATALSYLLPSPIGGNVGRLGECLAIPIVACLLWPLRRWLLAVVAIALASWQWTPAWGAMTENGRDPSTHQAYYHPLLTFLQGHADPIGRVEVVPTRFHWEAAYVAPSVALARGWERQLDTADNPLFYTPGQLNAASYQAWLIDSGVTYVALPDAPLDYAAVAEARLVQDGVPGLLPVWSSDHWQVFEVVGSQGIVQGSAHLVKIDGGQVVLDANEAAAILVRVRYNPHWVVVAGIGCTRRSGAGWTMVDVNQPGQVRLQLRLVANPEESCERL
jgi:hypothetical protein